MSSETTLCPCRKLAIGFLLLANAFADAAAINVCEVVQHSEKYKNKVVTVTGEYVRGRHGATIANEECGFQSRYRPFGSGAAADVQYYDSSEKLPKEALALVDQRSIQEFDEAIAKAIIDSKSAESIMAITIVGLVRVADRYSIHESRDGSSLGTGYGFMGRYPVQIVILKIKKLQISGKADR